MKLTKAALDRIKVPVGKSETIVFDDGLPVGIDGLRNQISKVRRHYSVAS
jgi:hypothetical protein